MSSTINVLTGLGAGPFAYREMGIGSSAIGVLTGTRTKPRMLSAGMRGYYLGLHNEEWSKQNIIKSGATTYYVVIVPICGDLTDPNGSVLKGTPTVSQQAIVTAERCVTATFLPFPDGYFCTGYEVWAGTTRGTYYKQGVLNGRFNTTFTIGTTWPAVTTGDALSPQYIGPPAFASANEVYQLEGGVNSRLFLGGGKPYSDGYARVSKSSVVPKITGSTAAIDDYTLWAAVTDGSFRMRIRFYESRGIIDSYYEFTDIDFSTVTSMADVATILQTKVQAGAAPKLNCGPITGDYTKFTGITDGSLSISINSTVVDLSGLNFSSCASMDDVAAVINSSLSGYQCSCSWDSTAGRFYFVGLGAELITNGAFAADTDWSHDVGWSIAGGKAVDAGGLSAELVTNGDFSADTGWSGIVADQFTISGGKANAYLNPTGNQSIYRSDVSITHPYAYEAVTTIDSLDNTYGAAYDYFTGVLYTTSGTKTVTGALRTEKTAGITKYVGGARIAPPFAVFDSVSLKAHGALWQALGTNLSNKTVRLIYTISGLSAGASVRAHIFNPTTLAVGGSSTARTADGTYTENIVVGAGSFTEICFINSNSAAGLSIDDVSLKVQSSLSSSSLSYLERHTSATGTDISTMLAGRETSTGVDLQGLGRGTCTDTFAWSTDHFVLSGVAPTTLSGATAEVVPGSDALYSKHRAKFLITAYLYHNDALCPVLIHFYRLNIRILAKLLLQDCELRMHSDQ